VGVFEGGRGYRDRRWFSTQIARPKVEPEIRSVTGIYQLPGSSSSRLVIYTLG